MKKLLIPLFLILLLTGCVSRQVTVTHVQDYEIRATSTGNCVVNDHNISLLVLRNGSELLDWNETFVTFEFFALPPTGATINDFVTLFFSVDEFDTQLFKYNGAFQIIWTLEDEMWYVKGSKTIPYTKKYNMTLEFDFNMYEVALMTDSDLNINFVNKEGTWSDSYYLRFITVDLG